MGKLIRIVLVHVFSVALGGYLWKTLAQRGPKIKAFYLTCINHTLDQLMHIKDISPSKKTQGKNYFVDLHEVKWEVYQFAGKEANRIWH